MTRATNLAHLLLQQSLKPGDWVVDATIGNGHDTLFLAQQVGPTGRVFGFDIQRDAVTATTKLIHDLPQVTLFQTGHEHMAHRLPDDAQGQIAAVMFNLGYLPGAQKHITTQTDTTLEALKQALDYLKASGTITLILYPGHPEGAQEATAVHAFAKHLAPTFAVTQHTRINSASPAPELLVITRLR